MINYSFAFDCVCALVVACGLSSHFMGYPVAGWFLIGLSGGVWFGAQYTLEKMYQAYGKGILESADSERLFNEVIHRIKGQNPPH